MLLPIGGILDAAALARIRGLLAGVPWQDGRGTAGATPAAVKRNLQADPAHAAPRSRRRSWKRRWAPTRSSRQPPCRCG